MKVNKKIIACSAAILEEFVDGSSLPQSDFIFEEYISQRRSDLKENPQIIQWL